MSFTFDSVHLAPEEQIGMHRQSTWELSYVIVGSGMKIIGDTKSAFSSGEVVMIPPEIPHCYYFDGEVTDNRGKIANITITFSNEFLDNCSATFPQLKERIALLKSRHAAVQFRGGKVGSIIAIMEKMRDLSFVECVPLMMKILLLISVADNESVIGTYREISMEEQRINQIKIYIVCNYYKNISLEDMARHIGMSKSALCVFCRNFMGKTFVSYLNEYRIDIACRLLAQPGHSVSDICYKVGFNDVPYFNRVFKKLKGVSPSNYRSPHRTSPDALDPLCSAGSTEQFSSGWNERSEYNPE